MPLVEDIYYQLSQISENADDWWQQKPIEFSALSNLLQEGEALFQCILASNPSTHQTGILVATPYRLLFVTSYMGQSYHQEFPYQFLQDIERKPYSETVLLYTQQGIFSFATSPSENFVQLVRSLLHGTTFSNAKLTAVPGLTFRPFEKTQHAFYEEDSYVNSAFHDFDVINRTFLERIKDFFSKASDLTIKIGITSVILLGIGVALLSMEWKDEPAEITSEPRNTPIEKEAFQAYVSDMTGHSYIQSANLKNGVAHIQYYKDFNTLQKERKIQPSFYDNADLFQDYFSNDVNVYKILSHEPVTLLTQVKGVKEVNLLLPYKGKQVSLHMTKQNLDDKFSLNVDKIRTKEAFETRFERVYLPMKKQKELAHAFSNL
ncbi:hypothetical protein JK635_07370 [Neobacillus sp. YIM B02564]|uniref:YokE-like PH domain-containing protein n=1 Tax=Neobacillus paridis TaxID=2803862 RepID=A0ABS1TL39_9BACI|nr:hypothetical protein [Neobacillus paridis]MBL4952028.1 hypothetical protein [Neobacillus paridis]